MGRPENSGLPLDEAWAEIQVALRGHRNLVLVAEPGAGKTTRLPPLLLQSGLIPDEKKILVLEPRRLAARAAANRIADEQGYALGREIGYQVRFENRTSPQTRLQFLTEGLLAKRLQADPELADVGAVILDEFHERSQHTDLALGLLFELQELSRPDLRLIVMSATLDAESVSRYLKDAPVVRVPGRTHPVQIQNSTRPLSLETGLGFLDRVSETIRDVIEARSAREGDVLVFLPGAREIRGVRERLQESLSKAKFACFELHGSLQLEDQDRAIRKLPADSNLIGKVILATNIAETSLTIDGVGTVIDSGLARVARVDSIGFPRLQLSRISLASATQRAGRAGRQGPGICYRLWSKLDEASLPAFEQPELFRSDLSDALMTLLSQGVSDPLGFSWFESPPRTSIELALRTLTDLGFRDPRTGNLTPEGRQACKLPLSTRLARLLLEAIKADSILLGAKLAALLSERDIVSRAQDLKRNAKVESDLLIRLHLLNDRDSRSADRFAVRNIERVTDALSKAAKQIDRAKIGASHATLNGLNDDDLASRLVLLAFPDRVCKRRRAGEAAARMVGGKGVFLARFSAVETSELFIALDSSEPPPGTPIPPGAKSDAQISLASSIQREWVELFFREAISLQTSVLFDEDSGNVISQKAHCFRDLPLDEPKVARPTAEEAFPVLLEALLARWEKYFAHEERISNIDDRLHFLQRNISDLEMPSRDSRRSFLEEVCYGETKLSQVLTKSLDEVYLRHLPEATARLLKDSAPETWIAPTGSRVPLHYPREQTPYLEIRLQEIFGVNESPRVARGQVPVVMHLLAPNFRPVQVTSDLKSFWRTGYIEVRKELRSRYPKHSWPEDPTTATPEAKGRRRN